MVVSTQQHLEIAGIKDGIVILRNGGYRIIMSVSTVNFALKNEQEQNSLIFQYQSFLNSLHFPIQIVMQSRRLDLTTYLAKISKIKDQTSNELLRLQTEDYIDYVQQLISVANIMKKNFYVVIEHQPVTVASGTVLDKIFKKEKTVTELRIPEQEFSRHRNDLIEKANIVASGLGGMGLHCVQLNTEEIIELFYKIYNPEISNKEKFDDVSNITSPYIMSKENSQPNQNEGNIEERSESVIDNTKIIEEVKKEESKKLAYEQTKTQSSASEDQTTEKAASLGEPTQEPPQPMQSPADSQVSQTAQSLQGETMQPPQQSNNQNNLQ